MAWRLLWNMMAVIGSLFTVTCISLLIATLAQHWNDHKCIEDPRNRKDDKK